LSHPLEGFREEGEYEGLCELTSLTDLDGPLVTHCLFFKDGDTMWLAANRYAGEEEGSYLREYWQFKGGEISPERWEIFMGVRYLFGRKKAPPAS
jgi:hypothetical protein